MEAKVDINKLQLLNDRINQTLDALNDLRHTVTGLSHSDVDPWKQQVMQKTQVPQYNVPGYSVPNYPMPQGPVDFSGIQHTTHVPTFNPYTQMGVQPPAIPGFNVGLSHTGIDPRVDMQRLEAIRLAQTFPFLNQPRFIPIW